MLKSIQRESLVAMFMMSSIVLAQETPLDKGHRLLIEKGLQIVGQRDGSIKMNVDRWRESQLTGIEGDSAPPEVPWVNTGPDRPTSNTKIPNLIACKCRPDEAELNEALVREQMVKDMLALKARYPGQVVYSNQWGGQVTVENMRKYMQAARPDMLCFDTYPFNRSDYTVTGGSPAMLYVDMAKYRKLALAGNDGTGQHPIPYGVYLQNFSYPESIWQEFPSESQMRLNQFSAWTFGYTFVSAYVYTADRWQFISKGGPILYSNLFSGAGDSIPRDAFFQMARINRQSRNLGRTLVRLISTDVRMKMGSHWTGKTCRTKTIPNWEESNSLPEGVPAWSPTADPYLKNIQVTNIGTCNAYLRSDSTGTWMEKAPGDVIIGFFKPLRESFDGPKYRDQRYFMVTNGLSDPQGSPAATRQKIRLEFDFGTSKITDLQRLSRGDGKVEMVKLIGDGGSRYHLDLELGGGTGDLFKYNTGAPFVGDEDKATTVQKQ